MSRAGGIEDPLAGPSVVRGTADSPELDSGGPNRARLRVSVSAQNPSRPKSNESKTDQIYFKERITFAEKIWLQRVYNFQRLQ